LGAPKIQRGLKQIPKRQAFRQRLCVVKVTLRIKLRVTPFADEQSEASTCPEVEASGRRPPVAFGEGR